MKAARARFIPYLRPGLALAGAAGAEDLKIAIDKDYPSLDSLYKTPHAHPELSTQEVETAKRLAGDAAGLPYASKVKVKNVQGELVAPIEAALGKDNVIKTDPIMASEDFSRYGLGDPEPTIKTGIVTLVTAALDLLKK